MRKTLIIFMLLTLVIASSFAVAKNEKWFDSGKPSDDITESKRQKLISDELFIWNTTQYWKEYNCYYFDLRVGNISHVNWRDERREIICKNSFAQGVNLSNAEVESLQLQNIEWTLKQLTNVAEVPVISQKTDSHKGEDLKDNKILDNGAFIDSITLQPVLEEK